MDPDKKQDLEKKWKSIVVKAVTDESFKGSLVADPVAVMQEHGISVPEGCRVGEGTGKRFTIKPPPDAPDELKEEIKWWTLRLDMTADFGKDEKLKDGGHFAMTTPEEE